MSSRIARHYGTGVQLTKCQYSGNLLSETDTGVDYLGESVYADAIAESIHHAETSITIGIYAKWGSGKSFLLRHIEGILKRYERQSVLDGEHNEQSSETEYSCSKAGQLCSWILCLLIIFGVLAVSLTLAISPALFVTATTPQIVVVTTTQITTLNAMTTNNQSVIDKNNTLNTVSSATTTSNPPASQQQNERIITLRNIGLVLIPVELLLIFIIGCYGRKWTPGNRYGRFSILIYGAFTKIPMQDSESEIVEDPGRSPADVIKYAPGDKRLAMAATSGIAYPRKYIFVNFKAWEYAGSDTLWAAIVTNISDAIEAEFGSITTRLFRMLTIQKLDKEILGQANRTLYIQFTSDSTREQILSMMRRYGVVESLTHVEAAGVPGFKCWEITYSNDGEYRNAKDSLEIEGVKVSTKSPLYSEHSHNGKFKRRSRERESARPLAGEDVPMHRFDSNSESDSVDEDPHVPAPKVDVVSRICCCCSSFCHHFVRHPLTLWKLPKLFWWILLPVCCVLIPVTAYIVANSLNLEVVETYREVPLFGQVLLWLPASAAVTLAISKFVWAMCHSQRQRINQALDGTKGRMASQLGFMSKVKNEIQVMTNLIRCARFIHRTDYRIIITIDDLDQIDLKKVHSVLEAVNILLSDKSSPFICIVAADPRIVVKCVEESLGTAMKNAKVTGREYLKKIINLPICLPDITESNKKRYIAGLIDQSDQTVTYRVEEQRNRVNGPNLAMGDVVDGASGGDAVDGPIKTELTHKQYLFEARRFLYENKELQHHLHGNARNMKRIYNVISMTSNVIDSIVKKQQRRSFMRTNIRRKNPSQGAVVDGEISKIERTKELAESMVMWIILVDQWPYRTSYIIQVIEDAEQRIGAGFESEIISNECTILDIFLNKVQSNLENADEDLLTLDDDPDLFQTYIVLLNKRAFTKADIVFLLGITINLDYSIRRRIAFSLRPPPLPQKAIGPTKNENNAISVEHLVIESSSSSSSDDLKEDPENHDISHVDDDTVC